MSIEMFKRGMKWRKERDDKVRTMRSEMVEERGFDSNPYNSGAASAGEHIDSYWCALFLPLSSFPFPLPSPFIAWCPLRAMAS
jgi:hypothetical protein